jgi:retron-type reverse transcriptase
METGLFICISIPALLSLVVVALIYISWAHGEYRRVTNGRPWQWLRARFGWGKPLAELARRLGITIEELQAVEASYKETYISKKRGGTRRLLVPDGRLKSMQRRILKRLLNRLRPHPAATGFEKGISIVHNALPHVGKRVVIKMDIIDFFPSTSAARLEAYFRRIGWNAESAALLTRLCTHEGGLPQGAPTSPRLANLVNWLLDSRIERWVKGRKGTYTRYADDITISFPKDYPRKVRGVIQKVRWVARGLGYEVHTRKKLRILRPHQQQRVTGLVVNQKVQLPRKLRRRLRAMEHHLKVGRPATVTHAQLAGWRALQAMIAAQTVAYEKVVD